MSADRRPVAAGLVLVRLRSLDKPPELMTRTQALRWGIRHMPADLRRCGFECRIGDAGDYWRVLYGYRG